MGVATGKATETRMAENQFARPMEDTIIGGYTDAADGTTDIYLSINEAIPNDATFIKSRDAPVNDPYVTKLTPVAGAAIQTDHVVRYRYRRQGGVGIQLNLTVQLRESYEDETDQGLLRASWLHANIAETFTTTESTLTESEVGNIVDYEDLFWRIVFHQQDEPLP